MNFFTIILTSCMPLSSSTKVISPDIIFFKESLNSLSCSRVSFLVSSYSSASSSSLERSQEDTLIDRIHPETSHGAKGIGLCSGSLVPLPSAPIQLMHCWGLQPSQPPAWLYSHWEQNSPNNKQDTSHLEQYWEVFLDLNKSMWWDCLAQSSNEWDYLRNILTQSHPLRNNWSCCLNLAQLPEQHNTPEQF